MRRVLCAFAAFNPDVGYVQGMNFIVVALLGVFDEAASFWMLALIVDQWLPEHFSSAMIGYHIDCRVLSTLTAEHLPRLANRLNQLDVTVQLLTTRWFLCLWSSVLADSALHRLWDCLFVSGPEMSMQAALACMHLCEPAILEARDIGDALCVAKDALRAVGDGAVLLDIMLARLPEMSREQLFSWRMHCRQLVINETRHVQATRRLLRLQRGSGFSLSELKLMARLCGPYTIAPSNAASSLLNLAIDFESFVRVLRGLVPQWSNHPTAGWREAGAVSRPAPHAPPHPPAPADAVCTLSERIFVLFFSLSADGRHGEPHDLAAETRRREHSVGSIESAVDALDSSSSGTGLCERPALTFEQLVSGLGWLLRGTSQRRADLCFRCFEDPDGAGSGRAGQTHGAGGSSSVGSSSSGADSSRGAVGGQGDGGIGAVGVAGASKGSGVVSRERFTSMLLSVYAMYEPMWPLDAAAMQRIEREAEQFARMMYELWDEAGSGVLGRAAFDRAAHMHPLLVQAFQLEQLDLPASTPRDSMASSPLGGSLIRQKNGIYLGLRPGAVAQLDNSYFGSSNESRSRRSDVSQKYSAD